MSFSNFKLENTLKVLRGDEVNLGANPLGRNTVVITTVLFAPLALMFKMLHIVSPAKNKVPLPLDFDVDIAFGPGGYSATEHKDGDKQRHNKTFHPLLLSYNPERLQTQKKPPRRQATRVKEYKHI